MAAFRVTVTSREIVKASNPCHGNQHIFPVSNLDLLQSRNPVTLTYFYIQNSESVTAIIKNYLSDFLNYFFPLAGRIQSNRVSGHPEILCNNQGAELVEAQADVSLFDIDLSKFHETIMIPFAGDVPLSLQVIRFECGGFTLTWCVRHFLVDGYSISRISSSGKELVLTRRMWMTPWAARRFNPTVDSSYTVQRPDGFLNVSSGADSCSLLHENIYFVKEYDLVRLQAPPSQGGRRASRLESFSAHTWKVLANVAGESDTTCRMGWFVDGRPRMGPAHAASMENCIGNATSAVCQVASVEDLSVGALSDVAKIVADPIKPVSPEDHFLDLVNWVELQEKDPVIMHKAFTGLGSPAVFIAPCHHLPMESDFGLREAFHGFCDTPAPKRFANGAMRVHASTRKWDGSWIVTAILWPQLAMRYDLTQYVLSRL